MCCGPVGIAVSSGQLFKGWKTQIPAVHTHAHQRLTEEILLGLADRMITSVVDHKYLYIHPVMDNGLQLLQVHLKASVSGDQDQVIPAGISAIAVELVCPGSSPGADGRGQIISHGRDG